MIDEKSWDTSNVTYPAISDMYKKMKEEDDPVSSRSTQTLFISNEAIETGINMSNIHARMVKIFKIKKL